MKTTHLAGIAFVLAACLASSTVAAPAHAQDTAPTVKLNHIPRGIEVSTIPGVAGGPFMAYDLDRFKSLARVDLELTEALRQIGLLEDQLVLKTREFELATELNHSLALDLAETRALLEQTPELFVDPEPDGDWFWTWQHLVIEGVLLIALGGTLYVCTKRELDRR
jgi:hypothetical protein